MIFSELKNCNVDDLGKRTANLEVSTISSHDSPRPLGGPRKGATWSKNPLTAPHWKYILLTPYIHIGDWHIQDTHFLTHRKQGKLYLNLYYFSFLFILFSTLLLSHSFWNCSAPLFMSLHQVSRLLVI